MLENAAALVLSGVAGMQLLLLQLYAAAADRMQQLPENSCSFGRTHHA